LQLPLLRSHPDPTANAAASTPPATPDAATAPTARSGPYPDLRLLGPIIEGVWDAAVERHRACCFRGSGQTRSGDSDAKQNPARQGAAIDLLHRAAPPSGARVLCGPTAFSRAAPTGSGSRFRYEKMLDWSAIDAIVHDKRMIPASHAASARAPDKVFPNPLLHPRREPAMERVWGPRRDGPESNMATALQR
jgi:hypothetical protein